MIYDLGNTKVQTVGDVHLGKVFKTGVPLDRRGEREEMIWKQFEVELQPQPGVDHVVQVGDILDKHRVDINVVLLAAEVIEKAAKANPNVRFWFLRGNHDVSRDWDKVSSFELLDRLLVDRCKNVMFIHNPRVWPTSDGFLGFAPFDPFETAAQNVERLPVGCAAIFGHWDHLSFGGDDHNLIPIAELQARTKLAVSGHDHVARKYSAGGMDTHITGSIQPFTFGEDPEQRMYLTMTLQELVDTDPATLRDRCVRILLQPGESLPTDVDCLQLVGKRLGAEDDDVTVAFEDGLNVMALFNQSLAGIGDADVVASIRNRFEELQHG